MFFSKKSKKKSLKCENCDSKIEKKFSFCPTCGEPLKVQEQHSDGLGLIDNPEVGNNPLAALGISEKMINSIMGNLMKSLDSQMKGLEDTGKTEIQNLPNGIKIKIGSAPSAPKEKKVKKKEITDEQIKKMSGLPRSVARTNLRRFSDKVVYELTTPGVDSVQDVFISKLESGYELKAIGEKKVYINNLPVTLPLKKYSVANKKVFVEFSAQ